MAADLVLSGVIVVLLLLYLIYSLIYPERF